MRRLARMTAAATLALALALVLGVPAAQPANAGAPEPTWLGCAGQPVTTTGWLAGYRTGVFYEGVWLGSASGSIFPCRPPTETDVFAIASYDSDGVATALATWYGYQNAYTASVHVRSKTAAICLIDNLKSRLDCMQIDWLAQETGPARPVAGGRIPVDSPLVDAVPVVTLNGFTVHPGCPTCVDG
jgi:hypothetical protein